MDRQSLKQIDILRHELKALRYILDNYHAGRIAPAAIPSREDFQSDQGRRIYDFIFDSPDRKGAEQRIADLELDDVDVESFLRLSGDHYHTYPELVRERATAIRTGRLKIEAA
jgi:hypothetical protein